MAHAGIVQALLLNAQLSAVEMTNLHAALAAKDAHEIATLTRGLDAALSSSLVELVHLYGDRKVLAEARRLLPAHPAILQSLTELEWLSRHVEGASVTFDLADLRGYAYYSGARFSIYAPGASDALARGGRYDEVGSVFGRKRPAVGFSLDVKALVAVASVHPLRAAIRAPWSEDAALRAAVAQLRAQGEIVVCVLPGHESEVDEFHCDRELCAINGQWVVKVV
jgi:ATP phosphoribosyltransferase regulatory subunit